MSEGTAVRTNNWHNKVPVAPPEGHRLSRRNVTLPNSDAATRGRYSRVWGYTAHTIARLAGVSVSTVRKAIVAGTVKPHDLGSIFAWVIHVVRPGRDEDLDKGPPLWQFFDNYTLVRGLSQLRQTNPNIVPLAVPMPYGPAVKDMVLLFWRHRTKVDGFVGTRTDLARRLHELDGIAPGDMPRSKLGQASATLRRLVAHGVIVHDPAAKSWRMAPFPSDIEGTLAGLVAEGFVDAWVYERHIVIGADAYSLTAARRLLAYMRTSRLTAKTCGRDRRMWIITGMDRVMHGYKERKIFRRSRPTTPG